MSSAEGQKDITPRAELLREAEQLITGDRNETYGTPTQNFSNIAALWNVQFAHLLAEGKEFTAADVALAQIHVKMARTIAQPKRDNFVDLAGYAACGWEAQEAADKTVDEPEALTGVVPPKADGGAVPAGTWTPFKGHGGQIVVNNVKADRELDVQETVRRVQEEINRSQRWQS